ncbi:ATP-binding cassette sub-family B member 1, partial [Operophtera brumata]
AQEGRTTIIVAHRLSTIRNVDVIYVFKDGKVVETGNHSELMKKKGHYYDMVMLQSDGDEEKDVSFFRVIKLNSPEWKSITAASLCALSSGFAMPLFAVILGDFVDVLSNPDQDEVWRQVTNYALIFVGVGVFSGITNFVMVAFFDDKENSTGALCARLSGEAAAVQGATGQRIGSVLQAVGTFGLALILSLVYEWRVGLVALTFVPVLTFTAVEAVANVRTVASLGREATFTRDYASQLEPALVTAKKGTHWRGIVYGLSRSLFNFIIAAAMYYGGTLIVNEGVTYSNVFKSAQALLMGASSAAQALSFAPNFQKGIKAAGRVIVLLKKQSKITDPDTPAMENFRGTGQASLQAVQFTYPTRPNIQVLKKLDLEVEKGKTIALVGASGCGKSTVIQLLERYYDPDGGIVAQDSIPLVKLRLIDARQSIGFVQQEPILFDRTIGENIAYGNNVSKPGMDEIIEAAKQANIHNFKQRVAIARALIRRPKMLLLDEATSALDTESERSSKIFTYL